jgi:hypothetical protein
VQTTLTAVCIVFCFRLYSPEVHWLPDYYFIVCTGSKTMVLYMHLTVYSHG